MNPRPLFHTDSVLFEVEPPPLLLLWSELAPLQLGRSHFGAVATVTGGGPGAGGLEVSVDPVPPDTGAVRRCRLTPSLISLTLG